MGEAVLIGILILIGIGWVSYSRHARDGASVEAWVQEQAHRAWDALHDDYYDSED